MHIENVIFLILSKIAYTKFSEGPNGLHIVHLLLLSQKTIFRIIILNLGFLMHAMLLLILN